MRSGLIFIGMLLLLSCCARKRPVIFCATVNFGVMRNDSFIIGIKCINEKMNDRNDEDYIKLWVNDTLLFSGTYYTNFIDSTQENLVDAAIGMRVATFDKAGRDSIKIRVRVISLDSILFGDKRVMDSTFYYRIDNIPGMTISDSRLNTENQNLFQLIDPVKDYGCWFADRTDTLYVSD